MVREGLIVARSKIVLDFWLLLWDNIF